MARSYGQIMSAIWTDPDFRALTGSAQRAYLMLITQADISSAGTLPMTVRRWAGYAIDTPSDALSDALYELGSARFIVMDDSTEELLVRKFVKHDGGAGNGKRRPAIVSAAKAVVSKRLRAVLAVELSKLGIEVDGLSDAVCDAVPDTPRVVVTEVGKDHNPETTTRNPEPEDTSSAELTEPAYPALFEEFWRAYPRKVGKADAFRVWKAQRKRVGDKALIDGALRYRNDPNREDQFTAHASTWLRRGGWDDEPLPARGRVAARASDPIAFAR